jgi:copper chaperone CopZ
VRTTRCSNPRTFTGKCSDCGDVHEHYVPCRLRDECKYCNGKDRTALTKVYAPPFVAALEAKSHVVLEFTASLAADESFVRDRIRSLARYIACFGVTARDHASDADLTPFVRIVIAWPFELEVNDLTRRLADSGCAIRTTTSHRSRSSVDGALGRLLPCWGTAKSARITERYWTLSKQRRTTFGKELRGLGGIRAGQERTMTADDVKLCVACSVRRQQRQTRPAVGRDPTPTPAAAE